MEFDFLNPDYEAVFKERAEKLVKIRKNPEYLAKIKEYYADNPVDFINDWGCTFDPRNAERGLPTVIPFLLFPKQAEFINWLKDKWKGQEDGLAEKSRDMGVSWLCVAFGHWMWEFHAGTVIGFGSRKEEYVDKLGDPKSLFWKVRTYIDLLPQEFQPKGYSEKKNAPYMRIINPENGSAIVGESGDNIGRGNRTSIYFKDESAFYERPDAIDAALSQTSNCKIDVSTPNGNGNPFYRKRHSGKIDVFTFHWTDDPRKDEDWYRKQVDSLDPVIVAQEIDIDYNASTGDAWINGEFIEDAFKNGAADVEAVGKWIIGVDAAHFGDDASVIHKRKGRLNLPQMAVKKYSGDQLAALVENECADLEESGGEIGGIVIELDGAGVSCFDHLKAGKYAKYVVGVHTGARLKDGRNYNKRARLWRRAKEYLQDQPVSLKRCSDFKAQISSLKYSFRDGVLLMQDKKEYKKIFGRSPDNADAFILTFEDIEDVNRPVTSFEPISYGSSGWMM